MAACTSACARARSVIVLAAEPGCGSGGCHLDLDLDSAQAAGRRRWENADDISLASLSFLYFARKESERKFERFERFYDLNGLH